MSDDALRTLVHDLATPLTLISGFAQILVDKGDALDPAQRADFTAKIADAAGEMRAILDSAR